MKFDIDRFLSPIVAFLITVMILGSIGFVLYQAVEHSTIVRTGAKS